MKKAFAFCLSLLLAFNCVITCFAAQADPFVPIIRFTVASDTHVLAHSDLMERRIQKMIGLSYDEASRDPHYPALDALLIAGDLTNDGTKEEFDHFWKAVSGSLKGETRFLGVVAKNHDGYALRRSALRAYYSSLTGNDADFHVVLRGYHFIGLSASPNDLAHYDAAQMRWLKAQLDEAVQTDPERPIFVMRHEPSYNTVYGSSLYDGWGIARFNALLQKYPQVVEFAGHSHYPLNDPRSIWQGDFTAIGTGAIYYSEFTVGGLRAYHPEDSQETSTCWIVELDAAHTMRLRGYDVIEGKQLCEEFLPNPALQNHRTYTPQNRKALSRPPVFEAGSALTTEPFFGGCTVTVPAALSADGMPVVLYRAWAEDPHGKQAGKAWTLPSYYRAVEQNTVRLTLNALSEGEYIVYVVAENAYGGQSEPLKAAVIIPGKNSVLNVFDRIKWLFTQVFEFLRHLFW